MKYSLFLLEKPIGGRLEYIITVTTCEFIETYDTLEEAQSAQKEFELKTIIVGTW